MGEEKEVEEAISWLIGELLDVGKVPRTWENLQHFLTQEALPRIKEKEKTTKEEKELVAKLALSARKIWK